MTMDIGSRFILCMKCKTKIILPEPSITMQGSIRYEMKENKLCLYAKCQNPECEYENLFHVDELLQGRSTEVK